MLLLSPEFQKMKRAIRTVLIDDSSFMRKVVGDIIEADEAIELVG